MKKIVFIGIALVALTCMGLPQDASLLLPDDVSQSVRVTVVVRKKARLETYRIAKSISVTLEDIARGYADLPQAAQLAVWCNSLDGVTVEVGLEGGIIDPAGVRKPRGLMAYRLSDSGAFVPFNGKPTSLYESSQKETAKGLAIDLRLYLPPDATPGSYSFDLSFVATPK